jgi:hypothetical protein
VLGSTRVTLQPAIALRLQSTRSAGRVAALGSLGRFIAMKPNRTKLILAILLLGVVFTFGWLFFFSGRLFRTHEQNAANRQAMLQIRAAIPIGASTSEVHSAFARLRTTELHLIDDTARLRLEMPPEGSEQAWKLLVDLHDGRVQALRIRTGDGVSPKDAPADLP